MAEKIFTIVTPVYNAETKIERTIKSVISNFCVDCELIIVDGGSSDNTVEIVRCYVEKYPDNIRFISEPDNGIYDAMNKGIKLARGKYINFQGAGDSLVDGVLKNVEWYTSKDIDIIYGQVFYEKEQQVKGKKFDKQQLLFEHIPHQGMFYKKELFANMGEYSLDYPIAADHVFNVKCFSRNAIKKQHLNFVVANYEQGGISENGTDNRFVSDIYKIIEEEFGVEYARLFLISGIKFYYYCCFANDIDIVVIYSDAKELNELKEKISNTGKKINIIKEYTLQEFKENQKKILSNENNQIVLCSNNNTDDIYDEIIRNGVSMNNFTVFHPGEWRMEYICWKNTREHKKAYIFGTGKLGEMIYRDIKENDNIDLLGFLDNNASKWRHYLNEYMILGPCSEEIDKEATIIIASMWYKEIEAQLLEMNINRESIIRACNI